MAAQTNNAKVAASIQSTLLNSTTGASVAISQNKSVSLTNGNTDNKADRGFEDDTPRTLSSGGSESLDLYDLGSFDVGAGAGRDNIGLTQANTKLVAIQIENLSTSAGTLLVGGSGLTTAFNEIFNGDDDAQLKLPPGAFALLASPVAGWAIADTSNHLLKFAASGGDVSYKVTMLTRS